MKRSHKDRQVEALARLRASRFENSRACRKGTKTREEWQASKDAQISHLEELIRESAYTA